MGAVPVRGCNARVRLPPLHRPFQAARRPGHGGRPAGVAGRQMNGHRVSHCSRLFPGGRRPTGHATTRARRLAVGPQSRAPAVKASHVSPHLVRLSLSALRGRYRVQLAAVSRRCFPVHIWPMYSDRLRDEAADSRHDAEHSNAGGSWKASSEGSDREPSLGDAAFRTTTGWDDVHASIPWRAMPPPLPLRSSTMHLMSGEDLP